MLTRRTKAATAMLLMAMHAGTPLAAARGAAGATPVAAARMQSTLAPAWLGEAAAPASATPSAVRLSDGELSLAQGAGWWTKIKKFVKKVVNWVWDNGAYILLLLAAYECTAAPWKCTVDRYESPIDGGEEILTEAEENRYFNSMADYQAGAMATSDYYEDPPVLVRTWTGTGGGGGGGGGGPIEPVLME